mgnify:CR=1 FL=1
MINRHQDPASKREEEFQFQVQQARQTPGGMEKATPEVKEAAKVGDKEPTDPKEPIKGDGPKG